MTMMTIIKKGENRMDRLIGILNNRIPLTIEEISRKSGIEEKEVYDFFKFLIYKNHIKLNRRGMVILHPKKPDLDEYAFQSLLEKSKKVEKEVNNPEVVSNVRTIEELLDKVNPYPVRKELQERIKILQERIYELVTEITELRSKGKEKGL